MEQVNALHLGTSEPFRFAVRGMLDRRRLRALAPAV